MSKFIKFRRDDDSYSEEYLVDNKGDGSTIGHIFFYKPWKKWVFEPAYDEIVLDAECLRDIAEFMESLK